MNWWNFLVHDCHSIEFQCSFFCFIYLYFLGFCSCFCRCCCCCCCFLSFFLSYFFVLILILLIKYNLLQTFCFVLVCLGDASVDNNTNEENCKDLQKFDKDKDGLVSLTEVCTYVQHVLKKSVYIPTKLLESMNNVLYSFKCA